MKPITKQKRIYPHRVAMYFRKDNLKVFERLENLSKVTGLSLSKVSGMALRYGVTELEDRLIETEQVKKIDRRKINSKK
jgi:hypothetical protein